MTRSPNAIFQTVIFLLCAVFTVIGIWYAVVPDSLALVITDDYTWYASLMHMYDATQGRAPLSMLVPNPFYGLPFWLISFLAAWPFFAMGNDAGVLVAPRVVEVLCASGSLAMLALALRAELLRRAPAANPLWLIAAPVLVLSMPSWWGQAQLIHPQHMLMLAELTAVYLLVRDGGRLGRFYWGGVVFAGVALAIKFEAVMLAPMALGYILCAFYTGHATGRNLLSVLAISGVVPLGILVALNPYLLTPHGIGLWISTVLGGVSYVAASQTAEPQHAAGALAALGFVKAQIWALSRNLMNFILILPLVAILVADAIANIRKKRFSVSVWLAPYIVLCFIVCLFFFKNTQNYYWMTPTALLTFALVAVMVQLPGRCDAIALLAVCLLVQLSFPGAATGRLLLDRGRTLISSSMQGRILPLEQVRAAARRQALELEPYLRASKRAMMSTQTNLDYKSVGLRYIDTIYSCLDEQSLLPTRGRVPQPQVDLIIFRKNDYMLDGKRCPQTSVLVSKWKKPGASFRLLKETEYLVAFGRNPSVGAH